MEKKEHKKWSKKRWMITIVVLLVIIAASVVVILRLKGNDTNGGDIVIDDGEYTDATSTNYFNGIIEPQDTWDIKKEADREVVDVYVKEGDNVTAGQKLFAYKTDDVSMQVEQAQLELDSIDNEISDYANQISDLQKQMAAAPEDQKLEYTMQIQELQTSQKQSALNKKTKQVEINNLKKNMSNAVVTSKMDGVVKVINDSADSDVYMTILATGSYQVKGTVDELNVGTISEGMAVVVHSRVNEDTWTGTITKIDNENPQADTNQSMYSDSGDSENKATKYNFYVTLDNGESLLLGQHVYIEPKYDEAVDAEGDAENNENADSEVK